MLEPTSRQLLRDALRPPAGYALDRAVTTTFSLDLMALLTIPVSFTVFQLRDTNGPPTIDPLALLEALRRHAGRLTVFCQAGQIHVPRQAQLLLGYLEETVVQVRAPSQGVFHPKLTVLRFSADPATAFAATDSTTPVLYRVLCSSRNLTFDRSWDTLLTLDGPLAARRTNAFSRNRPLSRFVGALTDLGIYPMDTARAAQIYEMADELLKVKFELPDGFEDLAFCPLGISGAADPALADWPILGHRRTLAMAPFVDNGFVRRFYENGRGIELIARPESLDELSLEALGCLSSTWFMSTAADSLPDQPEPESDDNAREGAAPAPEDGEHKPLQLTAAEQLHGLHAKLFVADDGWNAHVYTGSANATTAAFERNVEFLIRLTGKKSKFGVDALMGRSESPDEESGRDRGLTFADLLVPYVRDTESAIDATQKALERLLDEARYTLAGTKLVAQVTELPATEDGPPNRFRLVITRSEDVPLILPEGVSLTCHPLTLKSSNAIAVSCPIGSTIANFEPLSFESLTAFFAFNLQVSSGGQELTCGFVLNLPLVGAPEDRSGRLLLALLRNRDQLLRYLLLLLADNEDDVRRLVDALQAGAHSATDGADGGFGLPLLEPLLQALDRRPAQLDQIARLIEDLKKTPQGKEMLSDQFMAVWEPVWAAREGLTRD